MSALSLTKSQESGRFPALTVLRKCVRNWIQVGWYVWRHRYNRFSGQTNVKFRDGTIIPDVQDSGLALSLATYYYLAHIIDDYSVDDLKELDSIGRYALNRLSKAFTIEDMRQSRSGAGFGPKDATLFLLVRRLKPELVVETGVGQGVSTFTILSALEKNGVGNLISVDWPNRSPGGYWTADKKLDPVYLPAELEPGWVVPQRLRSRWRLILGRSAEVLPTLKTTPGIFLHDSEHSYHNMMFEFTWAAEHLVPGGLMISDDVSWNRAFHDFSVSHTEMRPVLPQWSIANLAKPSS